MDLPVSADLPDQVLVVRRPRLALLLLVAVVFTVVGVSLVFDGSDWDRVWGALAVLFFGVVGVPVLAAQFVSPPRLELDRDGFTLRQPLRRSMRRRWGEVSYFEATPVPTGTLLTPRRFQSFVVSYSTPATNHAALRGVNRRLTGGDESLPSGFGGLDAAQLAELLNQYRRRHGDAISGRLR